MICYRYATWVTRFATEDTVTKEKAETQKNNLGRDNGERGW